MSTLRNQIEGLSPAEKAELLDAVWESLEADAELKAARAWYDDVRPELGALRR